MSQETVTKKPVFVNPYAAIDRGDDNANVTTVVCKIATDDYNYVKCIRPSLGTNTGVIGNLWKKLINELKRRNITDVSDIDQFEQFVTGCHIISDEEYRERGFSDGTPNGPMPETITSDDSTRTGEPRDNAPAATAVSSDVQSGGGKSRRGSRKSKEG